MYHTRFLGSSLFNHFGVPNHSASMTFRNGRVSNEKLRRRGQLTCDPCLIFQVLVPLSLWTRSFQHEVLGFSRLRNAQTSAYSLPCLEHLFGPRTHLRFGSDLASMPFVFLGMHKLLLNCGLHCDTVLRTYNTF